jgi:hypothetical protein
LVAPDVWSSLTTMQPELRDHVPVSVTATPGTPPEQTLTAVLGLAADRALVDPSLDCDPWQILVISGLDLVGYDDVNRWLHWVGRWARASHSRRTSGSLLPPLLLCWRNRDARIGVPPSDTALETCDVFNAVSELDIRILVRHRAGSVHDAQQWWREHVLPPLVGNDLELVMALWEPCLHELNVFESALRDHARRRGWDALPRTGNGAPPSRRDELSGFAYATPERGTEWNLAWVVSRGDSISFARRLWRGQAGFLLPILDEIRFRIADRLNDLLGPGWALRVPPLDGDEQRLVRASHLHAQYGHLLAVLQTRSLVMGRVERADLEAVTKVARNVRNHLAHYRPIEFPAYRALLERVANADL